jgi:hypothetical protein
VHYPTATQQITIRAPRNGPLVRHCAYRIVSLNLEISYNTDYRSYTLTSAPLLVILIDIPRIAVLLSYKQVYGSSSGKAVRRCDEEPSTNSFALVIQMDAFPVCIPHCP